MPTSSILLLILCLAIPAGAVYALRILAQSRKPNTSLTYSLTWIQQPLSSLRYQPSAVAAIFLHTLAVFLLIPSTLIALSKPPTFGAFPFNDVPIILLTWFIEGGSLVIIGFDMGALLAVPISILYVPSSHIGFTTDGIAVGRTFLPWRSFSHFAIDEHLRLIRFYSSFSPDLPSLVVQAPSEVSLSELREILNQHLQSAPVLPSSKWYRSRLMLPPLTLIVSTPLVLLAWVAASLPRELALFAIAILTWALFALGGWLFRLFTFGQTFSGRPANSKPSA